MKKQSALEMMIRANPREAERILKEVQKDLEAKAREKQRGKK